MNPEPAFVARRRNGHQPIPDYGPAEGVANAILPEISRETEPHFRQLVEALGVGVYVTDADGRITLFNEAAVGLWGRRPELGEMWCGSFRIYASDGSLLPQDQCPMAIALKEDRVVRDVEAIVERPDGSRVWLRPHPTPLHDLSGNLIGAIQRDD